MSATFDVSKIEKELQSTLNRSSDAGLRTTLFNLVIFTSIESRDMINVCLDFLLGKRPARIIYIYSGNKGKTDIEISARCSPKIHDNKKICFQEIMIFNGDDNIGIEPATWTPLLIREIPVFVWWLDKMNPFPEILKSSEELIDKILINTSYNEKLGEDPVDVMKILHMARFKYDYKVPIKDFAWHRTLLARRWTARLFDPKAYRPWLKEIEHIKIKGLSWAETIYFGLWLGARLGWTPRVRASGNIRFEIQGKKDIPLEFVEVNDDLYHFTFETSKGTIELREEQKERGQLIYPGAEPFRIILEPPDNRQILLDEVDTVSMDPLFIEALKTTEFICVKAPEHLY